MPETESQPLDHDQNDDRRWPRAIVWLIPAVMWALVLSFTRKYASNVPYWDSWEFTELITGEQPFSWSVLWAQHNEHRMVVQTLFEMAAGRWAHWSIYRASFVPGILFSINSLFLIHRALQERRSLDMTARLLLVAGLTLILFSFRAHVPFTYEMVMAWGSLALAMTAFAWVFPTYLKSGRGLGRLLAIIVIAVFSTSQGLALAVFVLLVGASGLFVRRRNPTWLPATYGILAAVSLALLSVYFIGYVKPTRHPSITTVLREPLEAIRYIAVLAGSPFAWEETWATRIGFLVLALFGAGLVVMVRRHGLQTLGSVAVNQPLIGTNLIAMSAIMVGRLGFGAGQATASHYVPANAIFVVSVLLVAFDQIRSRTAQKLALLLLVVSIVPICYLGYRNGVAEMIIRRDPLEAYRACVLADPINFSQCDGSHVYPYPTVLAARTVLLRDHRLAFFASDHKPAITSRPGL